MTVTILVPVYGVEKYIAECAHSLFRQTYKEIEYVFCDDCTPDRSIDVLREVIEQYPERKEHVCVIRNDHNKGLGGTRVHLVSQIRTEYFTIVDGDDILKENAIELLVNKMKEADTDIVDGAFCYFNGCDKWDINLPCHYGHGKYLKELQVGDLVRHQVWGRLYKTSVLAKLPDMFFEGVDKAEDYCATTRLAALTTRSWIDDVVYLYRFEGQTSFNKDKIRQNILSYLKAVRIVYDFYKERNMLSLPAEIGILRAYRQCYRLKDMPPSLVDDIVGYTPRRFITRLLVGILRTTWIPYSIKEICYKAVRTYAVYS